MKVPTQAQIEAAAKKRPSSRTVAEQQIVDRAKDAGNPAARNLDYAARKTDRTQR